MRHRLRKALKLCLSALVLAVAAVPLNARGATNLLVNGGFDSFATSGDGITSFARGSLFYYTYNGGAAGLTGWTVTGVNIDVNPTGFVQAAPGENWSVDLIGSYISGNISDPNLGGISQTVTGLTPGQTYKLDFFHSVNVSQVYTPDLTAQKILEISVQDDADDAIPLIASGSYISLPTGDVQYIVPNGTRTLTNEQWIEDNVQFVAPTSNVTVSFFAAAGSPSPLFAGPMIDDVSLVAVPEPGTLWVLGMVAVLGARRTRLH